MEIAKIIVEIDQQHQLAMQSLKSKDLIAYTDSFADEIAYIQPNGKVIDKQQLKKDIKRYFDRITHLDSSFERISAELTNEIFIEKLIQSTKASISVFFFFTEKWNIQRQGKYYWKKIDGVWKIIKIEVETEVIS